MAGDHHYRGRCIGGPGAGRIFECPVPRLLLRIDPDTVLDDITSPDTEGITYPRPTAFEYRHGQHFGIGVWIPVGWTPEVVLTELARCYRPG